MNKDIIILKIYLVHSMNTQCTRLYYISSEKGYIFSHLFCIEYSDISEVRKQEEVEKSHILKLQKWPPWMRLLFVLRLLGKFMVEICFSFGKSSLCDWKVLYWSMGTLGLAFYVCFYDFELKKPFDFFSLNTREWISNSHSTKLSYIYRKITQ